MEVKSTREDPPIIGSDDKQIEQKMQQFVEKKKKERQAKKFIKQSIKETNELMKEVKSI